MRPALLLRFVVMAWLAVSAPLLSGVAAAAASNSDYRVGPGDILKMSVYRAPEYESTMRVAGDGTIQIGSIGSMTVGGLTPGEVADAIAAKLRSAGIYNAPVVNILVAEYHSKMASVLGAVARPGEYPVDRGDLTVGQMLARAGATLENGTSRVVITNGERRGQPETLTLEELIQGGKDKPVLPGDQILVQMPPLVYVGGEVLRPGSFPLMSGMTVEQAIVQAGDAGPRGSRSKARVIRNGKSIKAKLNDPVLPGDQIVVGARIF